MINKENFVKWLKDNEVTFEIPDRDIYTIFVYSKMEYEMKNKHPRKYKNIYIPYIRISWHDDKPEAVYTRWNGVCEYMTEKTVKRVIERYFK